MGFSLEWLAIKGATAEQACAALGAERSGTFAEQFSAPLMGAELPSGHYLILAHLPGETYVLSDSFGEDPGLENEVLCFMSDDAAMMTLLQCWANGQRVWSLSRIDPTEPFELEGPAPEPLTEIRAKLEKEQENADRAGDDVDYLYDMAAELGKTLIGFRHDEDHPAIRFEVLRLRPDSRFRVPSRTTPRATTRTTPGTKPWWKFW